jgi:outer membrane protein
MPLVPEQKTRVFAAVGAALAFVCTAIAAAPVRAAELTVHPRPRTAVIATVNTLDGALIQAYQNNPQLNAQRASVRATDENVPQALSGYRPRVSATIQVGEQYTDVTSRQFVNQQPIYNQQSGTMTPQTYSLNSSYTAFNGFQTGNRTRQAESQVFAARETLRVTVQTVLLDAVTAYMNLLRDSAILDLQRRNVEVLQEQLRQVRDRFNVGEVTRTDVAQSESRLAAGRSSMLTAESNYTTSRAVYRRIIGVDPGRLSPGTPVDRFSPRLLGHAIAVGEQENPSVRAAMYGIDVATLQVKIAEGVLYPVVTLNGSVTESRESSLNTLRTFQATAQAQATIPIYQGGAEYSQIRQSKETVGQRRLELAGNRDQARSNVVQAWGQLEAAKAQIQATQAQVAAAEIALNGVREEARVGQRTTLDVLNAQQELVNARVSLVTAQRDRVVASYALLSSVGRLSPATLGLPVSIYDPMVHYQQVRDAWAGVRNPDGR